VNIHAQRVSWVLRTMKYLNDFLLIFVSLSINCGKGSLAKQYWISYIDAIWIMFIFLKAVKENDVDMYIVCLQSMCPAMFTSEWLHYARYLPLYHGQQADADAMQLLRQMASVLHSLKFMHVTFLLIK